MEQEGGGRRQGQGQEQEQEQGRGWGHLEQAPTWLGLCSLAVVVVVELLELLALENRLGGGGCSHTRLRKGFTSKVSWDNTKLNYLGGL